MLEGYPSFSFDQYFVIVKSIYIAIQVSLRCVWCILEYMFWSAAYLMYLFPIWIFVVD